MANEAVIIELLGDGGDPIEVTVADGTTIAKGTIMQLTDPRTGSASSADGEKFIGIAAAEKLANDGSTTLAVYTHGIFDLTTVASPSAIAAGQHVKIAGANLINLADDDTQENAGEVVGLALETVAATVQETIQVLIK